MRKLVRDRFSLLENSLSKLHPEVQEFAKKVLALEDKILESFGEVHQTKITALKTRIHGDYHLGQVLFTGSDFVIIDFRRRTRTFLQRTALEEESNERCSWNDALHSLRRLWKNSAE